MKIAVFVDYSKGSEIALKQAFAISGLHGGKVIAVHFADHSSHKQEAQQKLSDFVKGLNSSGVSTESVIGIGNVLKESDNLLIRYEPDYVFVCTHGVKGIMQNLFGAHIAKLVEAVPFPCIVFQDNNHVDITAVKNILLPVDADNQFEVKIKETIKYAKITGAKIWTYFMDKPFLEEEDKKLANLKQSVKMLEESGVPFEVVQEDMEVFSAGFSRQTLKFCADHPVELMILSANNSSQDELMNDTDKEQFLINSLGIPVLCCNT